MLQGILILIIFLILLVVVIIMAAVFFVHKWVRKIKRMIHGDEDDGNPNSNDYFGRRQQYYNERWGQANTQRKNPRPGRVIDQRDPEKVNRKIIDDNVGEYVDFEETK